VLTRLAYLAVTNAFAALRLLPMRDRDKDVEILVLRHRLAVLQPQLCSARPGFTGDGRAFSAALLTPLPRAVLHRLQLLTRRPPRRPTRLPTQRPGDMPHNPAKYIHIRDRAGSFRLP
jgi:hypothetical protein